MRRAERISGMKGLDSNKKMRGKICLVTGANSGIGYQTALGLARMDATVAMVCRNKERGEAAQKEIKAITSNKSIHLLIADISSQIQVRRLAEQIKNRYKRLDVLINNAGISVDKRTESADGIEMTFATNYLGHFLLTELLLVPLKASAPSRIINVSSFVHRWTTGIEFDDLDRKKKFSGVQVYAQSKLAMLMFAYELALRLEGTKITVNALNPGLVRTNLGNELTGYLKVFGDVMKTTLAITPEKGAQTSIYLASSPEVGEVTGKYFFKSKPRKSSKLSYDKRMWEKLWKTSQELTRAPVVKLIEKLIRERKTIIRKLASHSPSIAPPYSLPDDWKHQRKETKNQEGA
jgi:NAD(P)-dependent dehydrogenase (short-subunit alcohol dehydrogenase family)